MPASSDAAARDSAPAVRLGVALFAASALLAAVDAATIAFFVPLDGCWNV